MNIKIRCNRCGICCKTRWEIQLNVRDIQKLESLGYPRDSFAEVSKGSARLKKKGDACIFLEKNLCTIQNKHGYKNKPDVCRQFPYNEPVCGLAELTKKNIRAKKSNYEKFFTVGDKSIPTTIFARSIKKLNPSKPIFEEYCRLLAGISKQKEKIVLESPEIVKTEIPEKLKHQIETAFLNKYSCSIFPYLNKSLHKKIKVKLPSGKFEFLLEESVLIHRKVNKKYIEFLSETVKESGRFNNYPLHLLTCLYFLPFFAKSLSQKKEIEIIEMVQAFSNLNGINRFNF